MVSIRFDTGNALIFGGLVFAGFVAGVMTDDFLGPETIGVDQLVVSLLEAVLWGGIGLAVGVVVCAAERERAIKRRLEEFATAGRHWCWETDRDHRFRWLSANVRAEVGVSPEWHYGKSRWEMLAKVPGIGAEALARHREALDRHESFHELVYKRQGPERSQWLGVSGAPFFDRKGGFLGYRGVARDLTAQIEAERAARSARELLSVAIDSLDDNFVLCDADDRIVLANRKFKQLNAAVAETIIPGSPYETYLRASVGAGLFRDAIGDEEAWITRRLALHRDPRAPLEVERAEGEWLQVREQVIPGIGTVILGREITELKKTEAALRRSEELLRDFAATAADWFWEQDADLRFVAVSDGSIALSGMSPADYTGKTRRETAPLDVSEAQWEAHERALAAREPFSDFRFARIDPAGRKRILSVNGRPVFDANGTFTGYRGSGRDLTEIAEAQARAEYERGMFENAMEAMSEGFALFDATDKLLFCNSAFKRLNPNLAPALREGMSFEEMVRDNVRNGRLLEAQGREEAFIAERMRAHANPSSEPTVSTRRDGRYLQLREHRTADGRTFLMNADLTEHIERQNALEAERTRAEQERGMFMNAMEAMNEGFALFGADDRLLFCNSAFKRLNPDLARAIRDGVRFEDLVRDNAWSGRILDAVGREEAFVAERMRIHSNPTGAPVISTRRDGKHIERREQRTADGCTFLTNTDLTDLMNRQHALEAERARAQEASRAKTDFLARMSHELRTPLNAIIGFSDFMASEVFGPIENERHRGYVEDIRSSGRHLLALVEDLLDLERVEGGQFQPLKTSVALEPLLRGVVAMFEEPAADRDVTIATEIDPALGHVWADERTLRQVATNLVGNAIKFAPAGTTVRLRAGAAADGALRLTVQDAGPGIPDNVITAVRAHNPVPRDALTRSTNEGTGLGLLIVMAHAERSGGHVDFGTAPDGGAEVTVVLPGRAGAVG